MAADNITKTYEFEGIRSIEIVTGRGNVEIISGDQKNLVVSLRNELEHPDELIPKINSTGGVLILEEEFKNESQTGNVFWTFILPKDPLGLDIESIECTSGSGKITLNGIDSQELDFASATGEISLTGGRTEEIDLTTSTAPISVEGFEIIKKADIVSTTNDIWISLPHLPAKMFSAVSTLGEITLTVPSFGRDFDLTMEKEVDEGEIISPFSCMDKEIKRSNDEDPIEYCFVKQGKDGPKIELATSTGMIRILTGK
jgi:hypothetical protein